MHYKIKADNGYIMKTYRIMEIWMLIVSNPTWVYQFYVSDEEISTNLFLKLFIHKTDKKFEYWQLVNVLKKYLPLEKWIKREIYYRNQ